MRTYSEFSEKKHKLNRAVSQIQISVSWLTLPATTTSDLLLNDLSSSVARDHKRQTKKVNHLSIMVENFESDRRGILSDKVDVEGHKQMPPGMKLRIKWKPRVRCPTKKFVNQPTRGGN